MRSWTKTLAITVLLGVSSPVLDAQEIGDRVRIRLFEDQDWTSGTLVDFAADDALTLRGAIEEPSTAYLISEIQRADWYKPNSLALNLLVGLVSGAALLIVTPCDLGEGDCITGSKGGHAAVQLGIGLGAGLAVQLTRPGSWKTWIEMGRVRR